MTVSRNSIQATDSDLHNAKETIDASKDHLRGETTSFRDGRYVPSDKIWSGKLIVNNMMKY